MTRRLIYLLIAIFCLTQVTFAQPDINRSQLSVLEVDNSRFPEIVLTVRVQNQSGDALGSVENLNFTVDEGQDISLRSAPDAPLSLAVIVDLTTISLDEQSLFQAVLRDLSGKVLRPNDRLLLYTLENNAVRRTEITSPDALNRQLESLAFVGNNPKSTYEEALADALGDLESAWEAGENAQIIVMGAVAPSTSMNLNNGEIPLNVLHVHNGNRTQHEEAFQGMATADFISITSSDLGELEPLWTRLNQNRVLFELTYRTTRGTPSGLRTATLSTELDGQALSDGFEYTQEISAPTVAIVGSESDFAIQRRAQISEVTTPDGQTGYNFDKYTEVITAEIRFPDDILRSVRVARLFVDGNPVAERQNIAPDESQISLTWDVGQYNQAGEQPVTLRVEVEDELGLTAVSPDQTATISVNIPEDLVEVVEVEVTREVEVVREIITETQVEVAVDPCLEEDGSRKNTVQCVVSGGAELIVVVVVVLLVLLILFLLIMMRQQRQIMKLMRSPVQALGELGRTMISSGQKVLSRTGIYQATVLEGSAGRAGMPLPSIRDNSPQGLYARLEVLQGPQEGQIIDVTKPQWAIGREIGAGVDSIFAKSNISALHCTITYNREINAFNIEDAGSGNGTYVNGSRLVAYKPHVLTPMAEIRLATQFPVVLRFIPIMGAVNQIPNDRTLQDVPSPYQPDKTLPDTPMASPSGTWIDPASANLPPQAPAIPNPMPAPSIRTMPTPTTPESLSRSEVYSGLIRGTDPYTPYDKDQNPITPALGVSPAGDEVTAIYRDEQDNSRSVTNESTEIFREKDE